MKHCILIASMLLIGTAVFAQDHLNHKFTMLGYRLGQTQYSPAYYAVPNDSTGGLFNQGANGTMPLGNVDFRLSRTREEGYYELSLDGVVYALGRMVTVANEKIFTQKSWVNQEVDAPDLPLNASGANRKVYGVDQDIVNLKFGWRIGKHMGAGPQFNMMHLYTGITPDSTAAVNYTGFNDSRTDALYSLGANIMLRFETKPVLFQGYISPEYIFGSNGYAVKVECNIFFGRRWGLYLTPFYKYVNLPASSKAEQLIDAYTATSYGIKAGLFLSSKTAAQ